MGSSSPDRELSRHGADRRRAILRHAADLFARQGFKETRVSDIAAAAGVAKGLVYWYFETKEDLLRELILDLRCRLRERQVEAVRGLESPLDVIYVGTRASVEFVIENYRLYVQMHEASAQLGFSGLVRQSARQHAEDTAAV